MVHHSCAHHDQNPFQGDMAETSTNKEGGASTVAIHFNGFELTAVHPLGLVDDRLKIVLVRSFSISACACCCCCCIILIS